VSDDYELGFQQSVPFGGFFSCSAGNPLGVKKSALSGPQGKFHHHKIHLCGNPFFFLLF